MARGHKDKVAVITGAASGLGQAFAKRLAEDGVHVACVDIADAASTVRLVEAAGRKAVAIKCDVSSEDAVKAMAAKVQDSFGRADIVINSAGIFPQTDLDKLTFADWKRILGINLDGTFLVSMAFIPGMKLARGPYRPYVVVDVRLGGDRLCAYVSSKAGRRLTRAMASGWGRSGLRSAPFSPV